MRIPSTSELVESQANKAYDKLAVISENLDKLEDIYEFIFNYYAFLKEKLSHYVPNDKDSIIEGVKEFHDEVKFLANTVFPKLVVPSQLESEYKGTISCHYADNDGKVPALVLTCGNTEVAKICLGWNTETNKPLLTVPDTVEDVNSSAVTVAYLKSLISNITSNTTKLYATKTEVNELSNSLVSKANDNAVVHLAGDETITGLKKFAVAPIINGKNAVCSINGISAGSDGNIILKNNTPFGTIPDYSKSDSISSTVYLQDSNNTKNILFKWGFSDNSGFSERCKTLTLGTNIEKVLHVQLTAATDWAPNGNQQCLAVKDVGINNSGEGYVTVSMYDSGSHFTGFYYFVIMVSKDA